MAAREDEVLQGGEALVARVDEAFEALVGRCGEAHDIGLVGLVGEGGGEVGAQDKELGLEVCQDGAQGGVGGGGGGEAEDGVELVHGAVGVDAQRGLADALAAEEARGAVVAGAGVDLEAHGGRS